MFDGVRLEDVTQKIVLIEGSWVLENLQDGIGINNQ
jgi:hypothetical protein